MPEVHSKLSASGAKRWMACPPSANLEKNIPDKGSSYAQEGTFAHAMAELILRYNNGELPKKEFTAQMKKLQADENYNKELEDYVSDYANNVWEIFNEAKAACPDALIMFEQRLDFSEYVPEGFGTGDVVIIADDMLQVIDLKYGKGVGVSAKENPQLRLYGIGAYQEYSMLYDIGRVKMTIIQPRLENISTEELSVEELLAWGENEVRPKALQAMAGEGDFRVGDHCRFCKALAVCRARAEYNLELAKLEFEEPPLLDKSEIGDILQRIDELVSYAKDIQEYAFSEALKGEKFDGWKLVEGRSSRKYADDKDVEMVLTGAGYKGEAIHKPLELLGITDMTKLLGKKKFEELLADKLIKPEGKPVLVPETDKRPELNTTAAAQDDFSEDAPPDDYETCLGEMMVLEAIPPHQPLQHYLDTLGNKYSEAALRKAYEVTVNNNLK